MEQSCVLYTSCLFNYPSVSNKLFLFSCRFYDICNIHISFKHSFISFLILNSFLLLFVTSFIFPFILISLFLLFFLYLFYIMFYHFIQRFFSNFCYNFSPFIFNTSCLSLNTYMHNNFSQKERTK